MSEADSGDTVAKKPYRYPPWLANWTATSRQKPRSIVPRPTKRALKTSADEALTWILPWEIRDYPGHRKGILQILGNRVTWDAVRQYRRRGRWQLWALELIHLALKARVDRGISILAELDRQIAHERAQPTKSGGFCIVRDDGRDRRGNWRR